jgi:hypothetical protein
VDKSKFSLQINSLNDVDDCGPRRFFAVPEYWINPARRRRLWKTQQLYGNRPQACARKIFLRPMLVQKAK